MNFGDQRTGGINYSKMFCLRPGSDFRRNTVGAENDHCPLRDLVDFIHKDGSLGRERLDHVLVMDNLPAHINGGLEKLKGHVNNINGPIHTGAESSRLGEQKLPEFHADSLFCPLTGEQSFTNLYASRFPIARQKRVVSGQDRVKVGEKAALPPDVRKASGYAGADPPPSLGSAGRLSASVRRAGVSQGGSPRNRARPCQPPGRSSRSAMLHRPGDGAGRPLGATAVSGLAGGLSPVLGQHPALAKRVFRKLAMFCEHRPPVGRGLRALEGAGRHRRRGRVMRLATGFSRDFVTV